MGAFRSGDVGQAGMVLPVFRASGAENWAFGQKGGLQCVTRLTSVSLQNSAERQLP